MGTSLTEQHAAMLKRYARRVVLAMDPDAAGMAAAERAGGLFIGLESPEAMARSARSADTLFSASDMELRVAPLPPGRDPDEVARDDPDGWARAIDNAAPYAEFLLNRLMGPSQPESPAEARRVVDRLRPVLAAVRDPVERGMYVQRVARHLGVSEAAIQERIRVAFPGGRTRPPLASRAPGEEADPEETLLAFLLRYPHLRPDIRNLPVTIFNGTINREVYQRWVRGDELIGLATDDPLAGQVAKLSARRLPTLSYDDAARAVQSNIRAIMRERAIQHQVAVSEQVAEAERTLGANRVAELSNDVWRGAMPADDDLPLAEMVIEELELGLSIHRREGPGVGGRG
jgi:DNA primase